MNPRIKKFVLSPVKCSQCPEGSPRSSGFTLLELLIVISIIAILSVALIFVINPAETLKKSRDAQRISDLNTMKTALGLYTTSTTTPTFGISYSNTGCKANVAAVTTRIFYSIPGVSGAAITDTDGLDGNATAVASTSVTSNYTLTNGTGWIPVDFDTLIGGSPISNLPVDPVNTVGTISAMSTTTLAYRYACMVSPLSYEIDAVLESDTYTTGSDNKMTKDGGNSDNYYEIGTNLRILGAGGTGVVAPF